MPSSGRNLGSAEDATLYAIEWLVTGTFIAELCSRPWAAPSRPAYVRGHIVDLINCTPPARALRWLRLVRLLRLVRAFAGIGRATIHTARHAKHNGLVWLLVAWSAVMLLCSVALCAAENGVNAEEDTRRRLGRGLTKEELERVVRRYPWDV